MLILTVASAGLQPATCATMCYGWEAGDIYFPMSMTIATKLPTPHDLTEHLS